jgi:hypothetical protein
VRLADAVAPLRRSGGAVLAAFEREEPPEESVGPHGGRLARAVVAAPDRIVLILFWTSLVVSVAILFNAFSRWLVLPVVAAVVALTWRLAPERVPAVRARVVASLVALATVAAWFGVNLAHVSQYVVVARDPGFLTLEGFWLAAHRSADLPLGDLGRVVAAVPGAQIDPDGYTAIGSSIQVQGAKLLPGLLALGSWLGGDHAVYAGNLVIGAVALLAVYGFARRLIGPVWALLPVVALAASVPMTAFSRSAYTEPRVMVFVFGGLTMTWSALRTRVWWRFVMAGALVGGSALVRIDGAAPVIGLSVGLALAAAGAATPGVRRHRTTGAALAVAAGLVCLLLGFADLRVHSIEYLEGLSSQFIALAAALVLTIGASVAVILAPMDRVRQWGVRHARGLAGSAAAAVLAVGIGLASRPLWYTARHDELGGGVASVVAALQQAEGLHIDPARSYDEMTVTWLSWYFGWPTIALGLIGMALVAYGAVRRRDPRLLVFLTVVGAPSVLYLWRVSITPDQIWAVRRLLPETIPGLTIAATLALATLMRRRNRLTLTVAGVLALLTAAFPALTWGHLFGAAEQDGRSAELASVCQAVGTDHVVYVSTGGPMYLASLWTRCGVGAVEFADPPTPGQLLAVRQAWGGGAVAVVTFRDTAVPWKGLPPDPTRITKITTWPQTLSHRPSRPDVARSSVYVGVVSDDGLVQPMTVAAATPAR